MSQEFKFKYDQMKQGNPASQDNESPVEETYPRESNARNVCFVQGDGVMTFRNYNYLIGGKFIPNENIIVLSFTSDTITLSGVNLKSLFDDFMQHLPKHIECSDGRYNAIEETEKPVVNKIDIQNNNE